MQTCFVFKFHLVILLGLGLFFAQCATQRTTSFQAGKDVENLENGCLIVRLPSAEQKIAYFEAKGWTAKANAERAYIDQRNKELMAAFRQEFSFCPVYFIHISDSEKVSAGNLDEVHFLGADLQHDKSQRPDCKHIYTATYGQTFQTTAGYKQAGEAITVCDQNFRALPAPFPRRSNKYFIFLKKTDETMVQRLNDRLERALRD